MSSASCSRVAARTGLRYAQDGVSREARARGEVILAAGAIGSPQLLELSGVGAPDRLGTIGVSVVQALPGVGENLQDHLQLRAIFGVEGVRTLNVDSQSLFKRGMMGLDYAVRRRGPLTMAPSQLGVFAKSSPDYATANIEFHVQPLSLDRFGEPMHAYPGDNHQRLQPAPREPRIEPCGQRRSARRPRHPAELSVHAGRSAGRRRLDQADAPPRRRPRAFALWAAGTQAWRKLAIGR